MSDADIFLYLFFLLKKKVLLLRLALELCQHANLKLKDTEWWYETWPCDPCPVIIQIYPDEGHFLHSEATREHLSQSVVNFFVECFRQPDYIFEDDLEEDNEDEG